MHTLPFDLAPAQGPTPSDHIFTLPITQEWTEDGPDFFSPREGVLLLHPSTCSCTRCITYSYPVVILQVYLIYQ